METQGDFKSLEKAVSSSVGSVTRSAEYLGRQDLTFLRTTNPMATRQLDRQAGRILGLTRRLCRSAAGDTGVRAPDLPNLDAIEEKWQDVADLVDHLLEKADSCLDELKGVVKKPQPTPPEDTPVDTRGLRGSTHIPNAMGNAKLPKPQNRFKTPPNNHDETAFKPLLRTKPHAIESFEESIRPQSSGSQQAAYKQPYETEIQKQEYPPSIFINSAPIPYQPLNSSSATFVDSPEKVAEMLLELKEAKEIAVDLEHHDTHSYIGIVCLMQISTREKDWIVDTLKPWREDLQVLNEVFTDPRILKVFHGASSDIVWLQKDFGLYIVSLFDTYHASHALHYSGHGLAFLLDKFVNFKAQKKYQMADWRIRPLPQALLDYARSDTHFLLYVYDCMRNELLPGSKPSGPDGDLMAWVLHKSRETALQRYERPIYDAELGLGTGGWYSQLGFYQTHPGSFTREQFAVYRAVHAWRDAQGRRLDENPGWLCSKQIVLDIGRDMPANTAQLATHFDKSRVASWLLPRLSELLAVVGDARARSATQPDLAEVLKTHPTAVAAKKRKREREERAQQNAEAQRSVSVVLQRERDVKDPVALLADASQFWGSTLANGISEGGGGGGQSASRTQEIRLHVPLPALTAEVFAASTNAVEAAPALATAPPEHAYVKSSAAPAAMPVPAPSPAPQGDIIVLRDTRGGSRKRKAPHDARSESSDGSDDEDADDLATDGHGAKGATKSPGKQPGVQMSKKARKKARRRERQQQQQQQMENGRALHEAGAANGGGSSHRRASADGPAFDYAEAPSVLNAMPASQAQGHSGNRNDEGVGYNPYAKSLNAPKGPKGKQKGHGKSATFKG